MVGFVFRPDIVRPLIGLEFVKLGALGTFAPEDVSPDPPWQDLARLEFHVSTHGHRKDVIQLFQAALLSLGQPKKDHEKSDDVQARVKSEGTCRVSINLVSRRLNRVGPYLAA
jgi:hypothetical protein